MFICSFNNLTWFEFTLSLLPDPPDSLNTTVLMFLFLSMGQVRDAQHCHYSDGKMRKLKPQEAEGSALTGLE